MLSLTRRGEEVPAGPAVMVMVIGACSAPSSSARESSPTEESAGAVEATCGEAEARGEAVILVLTTRTPERRATTLVVVVAPAAGEELEATPMAAAEAEEAAVVVVVVTMAPLNDGCLEGGAEAVEPVVDSEDRAELLLLLLLLLRLSLKVLGPSKEEEEAEAVSAVDEAAGRSCGNRPIGSGNGSAPADSFLTQEAAR